MRLNGVVRSWSAVLDVRLLRPLSASISEVGKPEERGSVPCRDGCGSSLTSYLDAADLPPTPA